MYCSVLSKGHARKTLKMKLLAEKVLGSEYYPVKLLSETSVSDDVWSLPGRAQDRFGCTPLFAALSQYWHVLCQVPSICVH